LAVVVQAVLVIVAQLGQIVFLIRLLLQAAAVVAVAQTIMAVMVGHRVVVQVQAVLHRQQALEQRHPYKVLMVVQVQQIMRQAAAVVRVLLALRQRQLSAATVVTV
jgi:hypothetical protein